MTTVTCLSWNIHRGRGEDGRIDPNRTSATLLSEVWRTSVDILTLQEADAETPPHAGVLDVQAVEAKTGLRHIKPSQWGARDGPSHGHTGVVLFLRPEFELEDIQTVDMPGIWPRGAIILDVQVSGARLRVVTTHLGLWQPLRVVQLRRVANVLKHRVPRPTLLVGDMNEWRPWGGFALTPWVLGERFQGPAPPTFPVRRPLVPLDRILGAYGARVGDADVLDGPAIRETSDHRPILADIELPAD